MAKNGTPRSSPTWKTGTMWSWWSAAAARPSRRKRRRADSLAARPGRITLRATGRSSAGSCAWKTTPIPPQPRTLRMRYSPNRPSSPGPAGGARKSNNSRPASVASPCGGIVSDSTVGGPSLSPSSAAGSHGSSAGGPARRRSSISPSREGSARASPSAAPRTAADNQSSGSRERRERRAAVAPAEMVVERFGVRQGDAAGEQSAEGRAVRARHPCGHGPLLPFGHGEVRPATSPKE